MAEVECIPHKPEDDRAAGIEPEQLYACSDAIDDLDCETAAAFGDDFEQWLSVSEACSWVAELKGAR